MLTRMFEMTQEQLRLYAAKLRLSWFRKAEELGTVVEACKYYGISRSEYYYWFSRWLKSGKTIVSLYDRSKRPLSNSRAISQEKIDLILHLRKKTKQGKGAIKFYAQRDYGINISEAAINRVLHLNGLIKKRRRRKREKTFDPYPYQPGEVGQLDVKWYKRYAYQYSLLDMATRIKFKMIFDDFSPTNSVIFTFHALRFFNPIFSFETIRTDQGTEFTYSMFPHVRKPHPFEQFLKSRMINHEIYRASPQKNGRVERSHRTDKRMMSDIPWNNIKLLKKATIKDCLWYNLRRPHYALNMLTPIEYLQSLKGYTNKQPDFSVLNVKV